MRLTRATGSVFAIGGLLLILLDYSRLGPGTSAGDHSGEAVPAD